MQLELFDTVDVGTIELEDIFSAYYECRKNKRRTINALAFEADFEENLIRLWRDINDRSYMPGRSIAFIVSEPVQREVLAADFRDRIVHHLIINKLNHLFEAEDSVDAMQERLIHFPEDMTAKLGMLTVTHKGDRFCFRIPELGS